MPLSPRSAHVLQIRTGRGVPISSQLRSHQLFSQNFDCFAGLVDSATLYHTGDHTCPRTQPMTSVNPNDDTDPEHKHRPLTLTHTLALTLTLSLTFSSPLLNLMSLRALMVSMPGAPLAHQVRRDGRSHTRGRNGGCDLAVTRMLVHRIGPFRSPDCPPPAARAAEALHESL